MKILDNQREIFKVSVALPHTMTLAERPELFGVQKIFDFPNGYGASVVIHDLSYGLELALLDSHENIIQHPDIAERIRQRPAPDDIMASRLLMARVPEGAGLIDNPSGGPQGFAMANVYVMAGIPRVMQAMLSTLEGKLESGFVVRSQTVRAYTGESSIADALARIQNDFPSVDIGSYPFLREERYGTHLVIRGADTSVLATVADAVMDAVRAIGEEPEDLGLDADA